MKIEGELKPCPFCGEEVYEDDSKIVCGGCCGIFPNNKKWWSRRTPALHWRNPEKELPKEMSEILIVIDDRHFEFIFYTDYFGDDYEGKNITAWCYDEELLKTIGGSDGN